MSAVITREAGKAIYEMIESGLKTGLKGVVKGAEESHSLETFLAKNSDDLVKAVQSGTQDQWLETVLKNSETLDEPMRALIKSPVFKQTLQNLANQKEFIVDFTTVFNKASRSGKKIDLAEILKKHSVSENSEVARIAQRAIDKAAVEEAGAQGIARQRLFANNNIYVWLDEMSRHSDDPLTKALYRMSAGSWHTVLAGKKIGIPVAFAGLVGAVLLHKPTHGESTKAIVNTADAGLTATANVVEKISPAAAKFIKDLSYDGVQYLLEFCDSKTDTLQTAVETLAERHGKKLSPEESRAIAHAVTGSFIQAAMAYEGKEVDLEAIAQILHDADAAPDRESYIKQQMQEKLGLSADDAAHYMEKAKGLQTEMKTMVEETKEKGLEQTAREAVQTAKDKTAPVIAQVKDKTGHAAEDALGAAAAQAHKTLLPHFLQVFVDELFKMVKEVADFFTGLSDTFNFVSNGAPTPGADTKLASKQDVRNNPDVVAQESTGVPTKLRLPAPAPEPGGA